MAVLAAVLLLLGLGRTGSSVDTASALTATAVGHDAAVVAAVSGARVTAADPGSRLAGIAPVAARPAPTTPGARDTTDGATRTPAPHLVASTGDRAPPALP